MKVADLIELLQCAPADSEVKFFYDAAARGVVETGWIARDGSVVLGDEGDDERKDYYREDWPEKVLS